ncbi:phosphoserine phosphatase [Sarotherodon galilaeus]
MEKFGMSFGGGPSRKELLDTVESQKKQLIQYQTRFRDVVRAYKSLLKEKEALEASLKVLSVTQDLDLTQKGSATTTPELTEDGCSLHSEDSVDTAASLDMASETTRGDQSEEDQAELGGRLVGSEPDGSSESGSVGTEQQQATPPPGMEADRRVAQLKSQLSTLTSSLATVTQEKSRMEASFQADKRQLKQEVEELQERLVSVTTQHEAELHNLQQQLAESRARIITQQHEREQEQGDHAQQLRELQRLLQAERDLRQDAELHLQDASTALLVTSQAVDRGAESEALLNQVKEERDELRRRLQAAEEEQRIPDPRVDELQQELTKLKNQVQEQVQLETRKVCDAEERAHERAQLAEARVAVLEQRVSELSELLGSCEKARQRDQQAAQRLRDRVLQLDTENKTLAIAASSRATSDLGPDEQLDVGALREKLQKVKKLLLLAAQRNPDQNIQDLEVEPGADAAAAALAYQQELRQLRDEFERYKVRAQVVLKNKNAKDGCQARELEEVRDQLAELREKYINLRVQSDEAEAHHRQQLDERQQQAVSLQQAHRQEAERLEALHRDELLRLEAELHKQRERTMALLDEKDRELERLRAAAATLSWSNRADNTPADPQENGPDTETDAISQALRQAIPNESTLLLYTEQLARKDVEVGALRRQKNRLEEDTRQLQERLVANAEHHDEQVAALRDRLEKLIRDQSREGANMEYLKNVVYRFLTLQDANGRQQTLTAILTILHFSPQEKHDVMRLQGSTWWMGRR